MVLERFGFTGTQAKVFKALTRRGAATGYAVARDTGLARANVYQALDQLVGRGLATARGGRPVIYQAAGPEQAVAILSVRVGRDLAALAQELGTSPPAAAQGALESDRVSGEASLVGDAARAADAAAREILAVTGPWAPALGDALARATLRGVNVRAVSLGTPAPEGAMVRDVPRKELTAYWGGLPVALIADRGHAVCGIVTPDGGAEGIATRNPGLVPFVRHLLRRELASAAAPRVS